MRVLFVDHAGHAAGAAVSLRYLAAGLRDRGHDVHVAQVHPAEAIDAFYRSVGLSLHDIRGFPTVAHTTAAWLTPRKPRGLSAAMRALFQYPAGARKLRELVKQLEPDIVHLNSATLAPAAYALRRTDTKVVWHVRESPPFEGAGVRTRWMAAMMEKYSNVSIFISRHDRELWSRNAFGEVIYCCTPTERSECGDASRNVRESLGLNDKARVVLFVGGFQEIKGFQPLVQAFEAVAAQIPDVHLVILGADVPPPASRLSAIARRYGPLVGLHSYHAACRNMLGASSATGRIHVLPLVGNVGDYLKTCEFLVFPSTRPHFARPVIEAALAGRTSIASRFGGIEEVVLDGETADLVPPGDVPALTKAMLDLLRNPQRANIMGVKALQHAASRYTIARHVDAVSTIYSRVLDDSRQGVEGGSHPSDFTDTVSRRAITPRAAHRT